MGSCCNTFTDKEEPQKSFRKRNHELAMIFTLSGRIKKTNRVQPMNNHPAQVIESMGELNESSISSSSRPPATEIIINNEYTGRYTAVSALTMDEALILLERDIKDMRFFSPHHNTVERLKENLSLAISRDGEEDDQIKLVQDMMKSYLQAIPNHESSNIPLLLHRLHIVDMETKEHHKQTPRTARKQQEKRNSVVMSVKEEFRLAVAIVDEVG